MLGLAGVVLGLRPHSVLPTAREAPPISRRAALAGAAAATLSGLAAPPALALITGSKPPEGGFKAKERKCKSIDECEALGEKTRAQQEAGADTSFERTVGGDRFRDLKVGSGKAVKEGDAVEIRYRVMRLGTKARDGLSGEGQTIFSFGYGEDDDKDGDKLPVQVKGQNLVAGVNDALLGMQPGGRRRVLVRPERGWRVLTGACAEGEKSLDLTAAQRTSATDGNLVFKADIGAAIENENACQNRRSLPQPRTYGQKQRFARRFDESLMVEVDVVAFTTPEASAKAGGGGGGGGGNYVYNRCESNPFADGCDS